MSCCNRHLNRREFLELTAVSTAAVGIGGFSQLLAGKNIEGWNPDKPLFKIGEKLKVQPILMYTVSLPKKQRSYKSWGGIQTDETAGQEVARITQELKVLADNSDFPIQILPIVKVKTVQAANEVHNRDYDVVIVYAARGGGNLLRSCFSKTRDTIVFVRHRSGPVYYWYEALSVKYLRRTFETNDENLEEDKLVHVDDVVVDSPDELQWRLRALFGVKNFMGTRIIALGGPWGKYSPEAPEIVKNRFGMEIIELGYDDLAKRIESARANIELLTNAEKWTQKYLALPKTTLKTNRKYVENCFILYWIFKDMMSAYDSKAFTIKDCMSTVIPMSETTACLTLGLLNDEGYMAFCESDFVIIPAGVLLRYISGKPVFLHNSTFPHDGEVTCAHCTGPRRMDGINYEATQIMTHYESEYGAAPKVEMPLGQEVTFLDPEYSTGRWLGFKGKVKRNPLYEICRSQQDIEIIGNWKKLKDEARDSHWMMVYGDYLNESGYAARKLGLSWENISES
jgi:hypothetical protein